MTFFNVVTMHLTSVNIPKLIQFQGVCVCVCVRERERERENKLKTVDSAVARREIENILKKPDWKALSTWLTCY